MIVAWPDFPAVDYVSMRSIRPLVYLLGSSKWYHQIARELEPTSGSIFYGILEGAWSSSFYDWCLYWLCSADLVVIWVGDADLGQFEVGFAIGRGGPMVIGVDRRLRAARSAVELVLKHSNRDTMIHETVDDTIHAARGFRWTPRT